MRRDLLLYVLARPLPGVLSVLSLALYSSGMFLFGWAACKWWGAWEAKRCLRRAAEIEREHEAQRERERERERQNLVRKCRARREHALYMQGFYVWHIEADTAEEALEAFHRRAPGLGAGGTR